MEVGATAAEPRLAYIGRVLLWPPRFDVDPVPDHNDHTTTPPFSLTVCSLDKKE